MAYFGTPLLYCAVCYLLCALLFTSALGGAVGAFGLLINNGNTDSKPEQPVNLSEITGGVLKGSEVHFPSFGDKLGRLEITGASGKYVDAELYFGDDAEQLRNGVGVYLGSSLPGYGSTVLVAGHNHTWLKPTKNAAVGDTVTITTYYGVYVYKITEIAVKQSNDNTHYDLLSDKENLVMYTCYPFGSIGITPTRYFLYGEYVSGPMINVEE